MCKQPEGSVARVGARTECRRGTEGRGKKKLLIRRLAQAEPSHVMSGVGCQSVSVQRRPGKGKGKGKASLVFAPHPPEPEAQPQPSRSP